MPVYDIRKYPDPFLRRKAGEVEKVTSKERKVLARMAETMYREDGAGLAGPQVGINRQFVVVDAGSGLIKLVNPKVTSKQGESIMEEGCLSLPGILADIKRAKKVVVEGLNEEGEKVTINAKGLLSHALQHEIDHLYGILIVDKAQQKQKLEPLLARLEEEFNSSGMTR